MELMFLWVQDWGPVRSGLLYDVCAHPQPEVILEKFTGPFGELLQRIAVDISSLLPPSPLLLLLLHFFCSQHNLRLRSFILSRGGGASHTRCCKYYNYQLFYPLKNVDILFFLKADFWKAIINLIEETLIIWIFS